MFPICEGQVEFLAPKPNSDPCDIQVIDSYSSGQTFGELGMFGNVLRTLIARTRNETKLLDLSRENMLRLFDADVSIGLKLLKVFGRTHCSDTKRTVFSRWKHLIWRAVTTPFTWA